MPPNPPDGAGGEQHVTLENLFERLDRDEVKTLNLILRADVRTAALPVYAVSAAAMPEDVQAVLPAVAGHRLRPTQANTRTSSAALVEEWMKSVPLP